MRQRCFSRSFHPDPDDEEDAEELPDVRLAVGAAVLWGEQKAAALALGPGLVRPPFLSSILRHAASASDDDDDDDDTGGLWERVEGA